MDCGLSSGAVVNVLAASGGCRLAGALAAWCYGVLNLPVGREKQRAGLRGPHRGYQPAVRQRGEAGGGEEEFWREEHGVWHVGARNGKT
jgi:hypothetical protein